MNPEMCDIIVDTDTGREHVRLQMDRCPTITATRGASHGFWSTRLGRHLSTTELMRCQGCQGFTRINISRRQLGLITGNAMSIPVMKALVRESMNAIGF